MLTKFAGKHKKVMIFLMLGIILLFASSAFAVEIDSDGTIQGGDNLGGQELKGIYEAIAQKLKGFWGAVISIVIAGGGIAMKNQIGMYGAGVSVIIAMLIGYLPNVVAPAGMLF